MSYSIGFKIQKPLQQDTIPAENSKDTKPNPAKNTYKIYSECANWCNSNNAYIEDKGDYYEVTAIPDKTFEEVKENKHSELKGVMTSKRQALTVAYDADTFDANEDAQANMMVLLKSFDLGATSVSIRSTTEQTHTFNKEHTQELSMLMLQAVNNLYSKYWEYKDALYNCKTIEEVEAIMWE